MWRFPVYGKGVKDHYAPPAALVHCKKTKAA